MHRCPFETALPSPSSRAVRCCGLLACVLCLALPAAGQGSLFRSARAPQGDDAPAAAVPEQLHRALTPAEAELFAGLANERLERSQELVLMARLTREKQAEMQSFDERLQADFDIDPNRSYAYDEASRTVYRLELDPDATGEASEESVRRLPHRELETEDDALTFLQLLAAKRLTQQQLDVFELVSREKQLELRQVNQALQRRFQIDPSRDYRYDAESRTLFLRATAVGDGEDGSR